MDNTTQIKDMTDIMVKKFDTVTAQLAKTEKSLDDRMEAHIADYEAGKKSFDVAFSDYKADMDKKTAETARHVAELDAIVKEFNSQAANRNETKSLGERFSESEVFKAYTPGQIGGIAKTSFELKALDTPTLGGALIEPQRDNAIQVLPQNRLALRGLVPVVPTTSNTTEYVQMTSRTTNAAPVVEGALKPDSDWNFQAVQAPIRTFAHGVPITRQFYDDVPALRSLIDSELVYGLRLIEEQNMLLGDGTGENIDGFINQASVYNAGGLAPAVATMMDQIRAAKAQVRLTKYSPDAILINPNDAALIDLAKDANGLYQFANWRAGGLQQPTLWGLQVVESDEIPSGQFLVGAFRTQARIRDRMSIELAMFDQHNDHAMRNMYQLRAENRSGLEIHRPEAFVTGSWI